MRAARCSSSFLENADNESRRFGAAYIDVFLGQRRCVKTSG